MHVANNIPATILYLYIQNKICMILVKSEFAATMLTTWQMRPEHKDGKELLALQASEKEPL
jgi:hypothetical protein